MKESGKKDNQKDIARLKNILNNTHTEKMLGLKINGKNQTIFNG
jgi:hypothetical protein